MIASAAIPAMPPIPPTMAPTFCAVAREGVSTTAPATNIRKQADGRFHLWERQALDLGIEISVDVYPCVGCKAVLRRYSSASTARRIRSLHCRYFACAALVIGCQTLVLASLLHPAHREKRLALVLEGLKGAVRADLITERASTAGEAPAGPPVPLHIGSQGWLALASRFTSRANELKVDDPGPHAPHPNANSVPRSSRGVLPVQRLQAWLKELGSSKPKSQAISEIGMVSSSR